MRRTVLRSPSHRLHRPAMLRRPFGVVNGDVLRMSDEGKKHAQRLKSLGAKSLADRPLS